jgi:hypothetical protein
VPLSGATLRQLRLLVSPHTVLRWHRDLLTHRAERREQRPVFGPRLWALAAQLSLQHGELVA